jgi:RHS repeat-associated protein
VWNDNARRELDKKLGCRFTYYAWDGDTLAFECGDPNDNGTMTHYVFEPGTFVPIAQAVSKTCLKLIVQPVYGYPYDIKRDPLWQHKPVPVPVPLDAFAWYQCDHLGTPMEVTDELGQVAWSGSYKAWGLAEEKLSDKARWADIRNPLRFQGQYFDVETGLHYNRHRYYDPVIGRFIGKDPIGFSGDINLYAYAPNAVQWTDPLGLTRSGRKPPPTGKKNIDNRPCCAEKWDVNRYDRKCNGHVPGVGNVSLFRDPKDGSWYSLDKTEHGSSWKMFTEAQGSTLEWIADLNEHGDWLTGKKHKGPTGRTINLRTLKCQDKK